MPTEAGLLAWLNRECQGLEREEGLEEPGILRRAALDGLRDAFRFPVKLVVRGYVGDVRHLPDADGTTRRYLELIPTGFSVAAYRVLGGILFPSTRLLQPGSVVTAALELEDPGTYSLHPPALLARLVDLQTALAIEP